MKKQRLISYEHLFRMHNKRLIKQIIKILDYTQRVSDERFKEVRKDLDRIGLNWEDISSRTE